MMNAKKQPKKNLLKLRRKARSRKKLQGTSDRPRLSVFRSEKHIFVQVIDDIKGQTILSASSFEKGSNTRANVEVCYEVGKRIASRCKEHKIANVVFDKNGSIYHGRVKAVAEGARESGLNF